ncbi:hypothetical protein AVEN_28856-1 [Araneus ventricosus]|uniref:Uncharacterized protein n=1 Tax=Araneus ventricosus TaxID=182803 RepID=A0A4Y2FJ08_ARAVE|nr:hypothetical protein AVEN_28856-1 [Araneus ventricosus]
MHLPAEREQLDCRCRRGVWFDSNRSRRTKSCRFFSGQKGFVDHVRTCSSVVLRSPRTSFEPERSTLQTKPYSKALPKTSSIVDLQAMINGFYLFPRLAVGSL